MTAVTEKSVANADFECCIITAIVLAGVWSGLLNKGPIMTLTPYGTLSEACEAARNRARHTIALVLGLEGARYYLFTSSADLEGLKAYVTCAPQDMDQHSAHAEMYLITSWKLCVQDFINHRQRGPRRAELFLSNSPCRADDRVPSPTMLIDGVAYPASCRAKLYTFFKNNSSVKWKIWYYLRFGTAEQVSHEELQQDFPGIDIKWMSESPNPIPDVTRR